MLKLITCIASEDKVHAVVEGVLEKFGIHASVNHYARGFGRSSPLEARGLGQQTEKVIINILAEKTVADDVFAFTYHTADLDRPHGGIIFVTPVKQSLISPMIEPEALEPPIE